MPLSKIESRKRNGNYQIFEIEIEISLSTLDFSLESETLVNACQEVAAPSLVKTEPAQTQQEYGEQPGQQYHAGELQQVDEQVTRGVFFFKS